MYTLYIVATPIGNLEDITFRAIRILKEVSLIAAEDTRKTRKLLNAYDIKTPLTSYFEHNKIGKIDKIMQQLETGDVALVSDAGTPGISDPGYELVKTALEKDIKVVPIPGASAAITALSVSGLPTDRFHYIGFLPPKSAARQKQLESLAGEKSSLIFYEAPHRVIETLTDIGNKLGNRRVAICREITKIHEELFHGTVTEALNHFKEPRGEFTIIIEGNTEQRIYTPEDISRMIKELKSSGRSAKEATAELSAISGIPKRQLYDIWLKQK